MTEWFGYTVQDFLLFSPATWARLLVAHNMAQWPLHLVGIALGASIPLLLASRRRYGQAVTGLILAAAWSWVGWAFLLHRYATINWAAPWFAALFAVQAALCLAAGMAGWFGGGRRPAGVVVFFAFLLAQPVAGLLAGRPWFEADVFGILPDATAMGSLGVSILATRRAAWILVPIPALWCLVAGATLWAMGAPDAPVPPLAAMLAVAWLVAGRAGRQPR